MKDLIYQWDERHASVLCGFLKKLNSNEIPYFLLRNFKELPEVNPSKDVDIIIKPGFYKKSLPLLLQVLKDHSITHFYVMHFERAHCVFGMSTSSDFAIHIDLIEGYVNKGYEILSFDHMYSNTMKFKNFTVLDSSMDAVMLILYKLIGCKELKEEYKNLIKDVYKTESIKIESELSNVLGNDLSQQIGRSISDNDFDTLVKLGRIIELTAKRLVLRRKPFRTLWGVMNFLREKTWRMIWCPRYLQKIIAVEAPDGTGKTTFINHLVISIAHFFVTDLKKTRVYHFRPSYLPNLGAAGAKTGVMVQDTRFTEPHRAKPAGFISSFIRMVYYWSDYVLGMPIIVRKDARFDNITVFDRYIYDFLVDPHRSRIALPYWMRNIFTCLVKRPRLVFVLNADAETIYKRKQELEPEEIKRQLVEFRKLQNKGDFVYLLDASRSPEEIANQAMKIIIDKFCKKI